MKPVLRRFISIGISLLALAPGLTAVPAQAAGPKLQVDDDRKQCHQAAFTDIQSAINSLGANPTGTITVCAGTYTGAVYALNAVNLKLIGKKGAVLTPGGSGFNSALLDIISSSNVTVQGLTFDGQGVVGPTGVALQYSESSGTIRKNTVRGWHAPGYGGGGSNKAIYLTNAMGEAIKVTANTLTDFQDYGLFAEGSSVLTITGNKISAPSVVAGDLLYGMYFQPIGSGTPSGKIAGNKLTSDTFPAVGTWNPYAIYLSNVGGFRISGNRFLHWSTAVAVEDNCMFDTTAPGVTISGNRIQEVFLGIQVASFASSCNTSADGLRITGNKISDKAAGGDPGINLSCGSYLPGSATILNAFVKGNKITNFTHKIVDNRGANCTVTGTIQ